MGAPSRTWSSKASFRAQHPVWGLPDPIWEFLTLPLPPIPSGRPGASELSVLSLLLLWLSLLLLLLLMSSWLLSSL